MSSSNGSSISSVPSTRSGSFRDNDRGGGALDGTLEALGFASTRAAFTPDSLPPVSTLDWPRLSESQPQHSPLRSSSFSAMGTLRAVGPVGAELPATRSENVRRALNSELWSTGASVPAVGAASSSELFGVSRQSVPDLTLTRASAASDPLSTLNLPLESDALSSVTSASSSSGFRSEASGVRANGDLNLFAASAGFAVSDWSSGSAPRLNTNVAVLEPPASPNFSIDQLLGSSVAAAILSTPGHLKGLPSTPGNDSAGATSRPN